MIGKEAFVRLFPDKQGYDILVKYHGNFSGYNANVRYSGRKITFNLSKKWKAVDKEIKIGLLQALLLRIFKQKKSTINIDLYNNFLRKVHVTIAKTDIDHELKKSFDRINDKYFEGMLEIANLKWGNGNVRTLGSYDFGTDTIKISSSLKGDDELVDYVMYHEMLHKKLKFSSSGAKSRYHTALFRKEEKRFENSAELEKRIKKRIVSRKRGLKSLFWTH